MWSWEDQDVKVPWGVLNHVAQIVGYNELNTFTSDEDDRTQPEPTYP